MMQLPQTPQKKKGPDKTKVERALASGCSSRGGECACPTMQAMRAVSPQSRAASSHAHCAYCS